MKLKKLTALIEHQLPLDWQESYDNSGLLLGNNDQEIKKVLCALDCTLAVVQEAINGKFDLIICHHPLIFKPIPNLVTSNYSTPLLKLIKADIALYAAHTNLDNALGGINSMVSEKLGLSNAKILIPTKNNLSKLVTFVPESHLEKVKSSLANAGAGQIGEYSECSFFHKGTGSFLSGAKANPFLGEAGKKTKIDEFKLEMIFANEKIKSIMIALKNSHPYQEPAYDIFNLANHNHQVGSGIIGELPCPISKNEFLAMVKDKLSLEVIKYSSTFANTNNIKKVGLVLGAGSFAIKAAQQEQAQAFITSEVKHHEFLGAPDNLLLCDIGHYESESIATQFFKKFLATLPTNLKIDITKQEKNPTNYFY
ncbi:MAG: Nif3-like dinuclear metal center hexameric protein [SAR324 cluster bacterium]|nr:Nif3-like dinuclear metal center hexameric protein [SAR324 cluster bacterium]